MKRSNIIFSFPICYQQLVKTSHYLIITVLLTFLLIPVTSGAQGTPVFVKKAAAVEKTFFLELYGNFIHEEITTINSPIVGIIDNITVKKGEYVKSKQVLFTVLRDDPGFTKQKRNIQSPFKGVVKSINAYQGSRVSSQSPVMTVASFDPIYLYAYAAEQDLAKIETGAPVNIKVSYLTEPAAGQIVNLLDIDPAAKMARVKIRAANPQGRIAAGTEGKVLYTYGRGKTILIPAEAVFSEKGRYFVWIKEDNKARRREIKIGELTGKGFECLAGITAGEEVIYYGYQDLKPGDPVEAVETGNEH